VVGCAEGAFSKKIKNRHPVLIWHPALIGIASVSPSGEIARVLCSYTKDNDMKKLTLLSLLAMILMTSSLLGCNAMRGAGTDIKNAGGKIENIGK